MRHELHTQKLTSEKEMNGLQEEASKWRDTVEATRAEFEMLEKLSQDREGVRRAFAQLQAARATQQEGTPAGGGDATEREESQRLEAQLLLLQVRQSITVWA